MREKNVLKKIAEMIRGSGRVIAAVKGAGGIQLASDFKLPLS